MERERCYACGLLMSASRPLRLVNVAREEQNVEVGPECYRQIQKAGAGGWTAKRGGPKLYPLEFDPRRSH